MVLVGLGLDASAHRMVSQLADRGYRYPPGDPPWLRSRPGDAVGQAGTGRGRYPRVVRRSANRVRPETEGHRARSRGDLAGCTRIAGLQCSDVLHESGHHLPAADDHPARWRACPRAMGAESRSSQDLAFSLSEFRRAFSNIRGPRHRGRVVHGSRPCDSTCVASDPGCFHLWTIRHAKRRALRLMWSSRRRA